MCCCNSCLAGDSNNCEYHFPLVGEDLWEDYTPRCPGFVTEIHFHECGSEVDEEGDICAGCEILREEAERMVEELVERAHQRELDTEEEQLMRQYGDGDKLSYPDIFEALINELPWSTTYLIVTEGDSEYLFVGEDRKEAIQEYEEQLLVPGDAFSEVASCIKLATQVRLLLKSNSREAERLLSLWWDENLAQKDSVKKGR